MRSTHVAASLAVAGLALACLTAGAIAQQSDAGGEVWQVVEGPNGGTKGVWNVVRNGNSFRGSAHMQKPNGAALTYGVTGQLSGDKLVLHRIESSDRSECLYLATSAPNPRTDGTSICGRENGVWRVVVQPRSSGSETRR